MPASFGGRRTRSSNPATAAIRWGWTPCRSDEILPDWSTNGCSSTGSAHQLRLLALERLCGQLAANRGLARGRSLPCGPGCRALARNAERQFIEVYLSEGNRADALRQFTSYQRVIREEVGVEPSREIAELVSPLTVARPARD